MNNDYIRNMFLAILPGIFFLLIGISIKLNEILNVLDTLK